MAFSASLFRRDRPVVSEQGLAIWSYPAAPSTSPDLTVKLEADFGSGFFAGANKAAPLYLKVYSQLSNGPKLTPEQVALLIRGGSVFGEFKPVSPPRAPYRAYLAISDIQKVPWKSQPEKCDRILRFGRAFTMDKTEAGHTQQWGWEVDKVVFPRRIKHGGANLEFEPAQAFQCLRLGQCQVHAHKVVYAGAVKKGDEFLPSAKLQISLLREQTRGVQIQSSSASLMQ